MEREIRKLWDKRAEKFGEHPWATGWGGHLREIEVSEVRRTIPKEGNILDLGCGNGYVLEQIISHGRNLAGIDLSPRMTRVAKRRLREDSEVVEGNVVFLPFKDKCFDYVYSIRTLINVVPKEKQEKAIEEAVRVLKVGGFLMLIECSKEGIKNINKLRRLFSIPELQIWRNHLFFDKRRIETALKQNHVRILRKTHYPIIAVLEKVFYQKVRRIRGATRLFSVLYTLVYPMDRTLCRFFPIMGHNMLYIGQKRKES